MRELNLKSSKVHQILESNGFVFEQSVSVWHPLTLPEFAYSDGDDVENYVLEVVKHAQDLSVNSVELSAKMKDWPSTYHLSSRRANLLRPFQEWFKGKRILEIGCGCGAITRFLAESGAQVLSVEGSFRRAQIARQRCRDLDNVDVICSPSDQLPDIGAFDGVMLIGVLEYARMFLGANGQHVLLDFCRQRLVQDGQLFIAIENKLGIKYFAGANEDHVGQPMFGINNSYTDNSVATFGRHELLALLNECGFTDTKEYIPLPDYKLPVSIVTPIGWQKYARELSQLAIESSNKDIQGISENLFSVEQGVGNAWRNGLAVDLANSFLLIASKQQQSEFTPGIAAYHYTDGRLLKFNKVTTFDVISDGKLIVKCSPLIESECEGITRQNIKNRDAFYAGNSLWLELINIVNRPDWTLQQVAQWAKEWIAALASVAKVTASSYDKDLLLDNDYQDAMPFNAIRQYDGSVVFFDLEWFIPQVNLTLGYVVFRGIFHSLLRMTSVAHSQHLSSLNIIDISLELMKQIGFAVEQDDLNRYLNQESQFIAVVHGQDSSDIYPHLMAGKLLMRIASVGGLKNQYEAQICAKDAQNSDLRKDIISLEQQVAEGEKLLVDQKRLLIDQKNLLIDQKKLLVDQNKSLAEYEYQVSQIFSSSSWKLSASLQKLGRKLPSFLRKPIISIFKWLF